MLHDLVYQQSTGALLLEDSRGCSAFLARGYSGKPGAVNDPDREGEVAVGPIPRGMWRLGKPITHASLGPVAIPLRPVAVVNGEVVQQTKRLGRSGFYIHGDNSHGNQSASNGCIILPRAIRDAIVSLGITRLTVV